MGQQFELSAQHLQRLIDKTRFAISTEETRYYLNGIYLHTAQSNKKATLRAVATDGHRLAQVELPLPEGAQGMPGIIIPRKTVHELHRLIEDSQATVKVGVSPAKVRFEIGVAAECGTVTRDITVAAAQPAGPRATQGSVWPVRDSWNRGTENLYSAWIETLFDAPLDQAPSWPALHEVLRDKSRNILFNHLGLGEDEKKLIYQPDCADLPYFLRAYFAFKMRLPFGYSKCSRGGGGQAPRCPQWWNIQNEEPPPAPPGPQYASGGFFGAPVARPAPRVAPRPQGLVPGFGYYVRTTVADAVHSGNGRTALADDNSDYYPVPLTLESLRPGTIYADPYGHVLVIAKRLPQNAERGGVLLAVDGQPDGTVARKRYWRGNFLYATQRELGGPGLQALSARRRRAARQLVRLDDEAIAKRAPTTATSRASREARRRGLLRHDGRRALAARRSIRSARCWRRSPRSRSRCARA